MAVVGTVITAVAGFFELLFACIFAVHKCKKEKICCFAPENSENGDSRRNSINSEDIELSLVRHESNLYHKLDDSDQNKNGNKNKIEEKRITELEIPLLNENNVESNSDYIYQTCFENPFQKNNQLINLSNI